MDHWYNSPYAWMAGAAIVVTGLAVTAEIWGAGAAAVLAAEELQSLYALAASDSLSCTAANAPKKPKETAPTRSKGPAKATGTAGQAAQAEPELPEGARAPQEGPDSNTVPNPEHVYWEEDGCTVVGLKREGRDPKAIAWDCGGQAGESGKSAPGKGGTPEADDRSGYATIYLDRPAAHATIAVTHNGNTIHTNQEGEGGTEAVGAFWTDEHSAITLRIKFPLPDAKRAQDFQLATEGHIFGDYDLQTRSCITYCLDVLGAGGFEDVPPPEYGWQPSIMWIIRHDD